MISLNRCFGLALCCATVASCGGGGDGSSGGPASPSPAPSFSLGGTVSGLSGTGLTLRNNGGNDLAVAANGNFTFGAQTSGTAAYSVTVATQPVNPSQTCTILNPTGTLPNASVTNLAIACTINYFSVGGHVAGLLGSGLALEINAANPLTLAADGSFTFLPSLPSGSTYAVNVAAQPVNPSQTCTVTNPAGTLASADVTNIRVDCISDAYKVGGTVTGLAGPGLTLDLNGADPLSIGADGRFTFASGLSSGTRYAVTIVTQPSSPASPCLITRSSGTVGSQDELSVRVVCGESIGTVGGTVTGLRGTGLELRNNGGDSLMVNSDGPFVFDSVMSFGSTYSVTVDTSNLRPRQVCTVSGGSGTVNARDVTSVSIDCALRPGNLRASVPPPTYPPGSGELQTFTSLNGARSGGGFGQLAQDAKLDAAARAHALYLATHSYSAGRFDPAPLSADAGLGGIGAHAEQPGDSQFTGALPADRARAAGYGWLDGAEAAVFNVGTASRDCSDQILDSLVLRHRIMDTAMRDIGVGIADTADGKGFVCVVLAAYADFRGEAPGGWLGVYPFEGAEPISLAMASDATGQSFGTNRGMPVMFMSDRDAPLSLTVDLRNSATGALIGSTTVTHATLPDELGSNESFVIPSVYLEPNTGYSVHAIGTVEGLPVDQTTHFRTGARSNSAPFATTLAPRSMRAVYAYPTDRAVNDEYRAGVQMALEHVQGWFQQQLGGQTFPIYGALPEVCALPHASAHYVYNAWLSVETDILTCLPARSGDPDYDWVVYADVYDGCNSAGRLGGGEASFALLAREDLDGLTGHDSGVDGCGNPRAAPPLGFWIGKLGHEIGHTLHVSHPPGCEAPLGPCDSASIMWLGYTVYPATYFGSSDWATLKGSRFMNVQRFGR